MPLYLLSFPGASDPNENDMDVYGGELATWLEVHWAICGAWMGGLPSRLLGNASLATKRKLGFWLVGYARSQGLPQVHGDSEPIMHQLVTSFVQVFLGDWVHGRDQSHGPRLPSDQGPVHTPTPTHLLL